MTMVERAQMLDLDKNNTNRMALLDSLLCDGGAIVPVYQTENAKRPHIYLMHEDGTTLAIGATLKDAADNFANTINSTEFPDPEPEPPKKARARKKAQE